MNKPKWPYAVIAAAIAAVFYPCLCAGYVNWDDFKTVVENPLLQDRSARGIGALFSSFTAGHYQPLALLSFMAEQAAFGTGAAVSHAVNLVLHLLNSWLVYMLAVRLLADWRKSLFAALLFAIHPLHVESAAWISERKDLVYSFFYLCALLAYLRGWYWRTLGLFALSLLGKSMAVTLPLVLLLVDWRAEGKITARQLARKLPFAALSLVFGITAVVSQHKADFAAAYSWDKAAGGFFIACGNLLFYLAKFIAPLGLSAFYPFPGKGEFAVPGLYYGAPVLIAAILWFLRGHLRGMAAFGLLFFAAAIAPALEFVPIGRAIAADHFTYLPYIGIILWICGAVPSGKRAAVFAALWLAGLGALAHRRCHVWQDSVSLWTDAAEKFPLSPVTRINKGIALRRAGQSDAALSEFSAALALDPRSALAHSNIGITLAEKGDIPAALEHFRIAAETEPQNPDFRRNLKIIQKHKSRSPEETRR